MKTWSGTDLAGFVLSLFGIICVLFSNSPWLTNFAFVFASFCFMHSVYKARYQNVQYHEMLCHYQAVLSAAEEGWIAWNDENEYVGSSKKFRELMLLKKNAPIRIIDIIDNLQSDSADNFTTHLTKLLKNGEEFNLIAQTKSGRNIELRGARKIISKIESIAIWCRDITEISSEFEKIRTVAEEATDFSQRKVEILNALPLPVWRRDKNLRIVFCNKFYAHMLGKKVDDVITGNIPLVPGSLFGQGHSLAENAKKCNKSQSVVQHIIVGGIRKQFSIHECVSSDGFIGYALDISSTEKLASQLDKLITSNCEVLNGISSAIAIYDSNMKLAFFNNSFQYMMKLENGWLHSKPTFSEVLDELRSNRRLPEVADFQAFKKDQLALFTSVVEPVQNMIHLPNGKSLRQMITPYTAGGLVFIYEDVTNSLLLQQKNNTLLAVQKETIDHLYEGVIVCGSDNRVKIMNKSLADIWGLDLELLNVKEMHLSDLLNNIKDQLDFEGEWTKFREYAVSNLTDRMPKTGRLTKKNGHVILFSYVPLPDGAHMHSMVDITDTCTVENAILEKNQALHAAHRLEMEFIAGVSTEIKSPLSVLVEASDLLLHEYYGHLNDKQKNFCKYIFDAANQLHQLINNTIDMVAVDKSPAKLVFDNFSITEAIDEVLLNLHQRLQEKNIEIIKSYDENVPEFYGNKVRMKQVLFNIILNAVQYSPNSGIVEVVLRFNDDEMKILVKDTGFRHGGQKGGKRRIFTRISKDEALRPTTSEHNISMPLVRSLVAKHGGRIKIVSDVKGTSVLCTFPRQHKNKISPDDSGTPSQTGTIVELPKDARAVS